MKFSALILLGIGMGSMAHAAPPLSDRSQRTFKVLTNNASGTLVKADLVVAYQGSIPVGMDLAALMKTTSKALFDATKGAVQLGTVTVVPTSPKSDPDILIIDGLCPPEVKKTGDGTVCADAHTGGYVGTKWWEPTLGTAGNETFQKLSSTEGAHVTISWSTLQNYGAKALVHEFGHYLFSMRDEYEGVSFAAGESELNSEYLAAPWENPSPSDVGQIGTGRALAGASPAFPLVATTPGGKTYTNSFFGYAMGLVSSVDLVKGYSPFMINALTPVAGFPVADGSTTNGDGDPIWWAAEQFASRPTRGNERDASATFRFGGLWSMVTTLRTALGATYVPPASAIATAAGVVVPTAYLESATVTTIYQVGQGNVFVVDRSGSMGWAVENGYYVGMNKWQVAMDFFGRMTHPDGSLIKYSPSAHFGVVAFDDMRPVEPSGVEYVREVGGVKTYRGISDLAGVTTAVADLNSPLKWQPASPAIIPAPGGNTNLVEALDTAQSRLDLDVSKPYMRNVILISDGAHNSGPKDFTGNEGRDGSYRVFAVTIDTKPGDVDGYGAKMQALANNSRGPDNSSGQVFFTSDATSANGQLGSIAQAISNAILGSDLTDFGEALLFRDAARAYSVTTDAGQTRATLSVGWSSTYVPTLTLTSSTGQTITEAGVAGVKFVKQGNLKSFEIDLTKFPAGKWTMNVTAPNASEPVLIFPTASVLGTGVQVDLKMDTKFATATGKIPLTVTVQDGRPILGASVVATLTNAITGIVNTQTLLWDRGAAAYVGDFSGNIQPGLSKLNLTVSHPNNGKVVHLPGENTFIGALPQVPLFATRNISRDIWVDGAATIKKTVAVEAWTKQEQTSFAQGTNLKLFLKNNSTVPLTGLKARYFFNVSEIPGGVPSWSQMYMPGQPIVKVGTVLGRPTLAYVEFDYAGKTLQPNASSSNGTNGGDQIYVIESSWRTPWNPGNDYSFRGLKTTWSANSFVNVYDATGKLISGNPDLDPIVAFDNSKPVVTIKVPDLLVAGTTALFTANAVDPDGDALTYNWTLDGTAIGTSASVSYTGLTAGTHALVVNVNDGKGGVTSVAMTIQVQAAAGACTDGIDLGNASTPTLKTLVNGVNCFKVSADKMNRDWKWTNIVFQANSSGVTLSGVSVQALPVGSVTALSGYSKSVNFADPGAKKNLYLKVVSNASKPVTLNWWLQ